MLGKLYIVFKALLFSAYWLLNGLLVFWAFHFRDPHLLFVRDYELGIYLLLLSFSFPIVFFIKHKIIRNSLIVLVVALLVKAVVSYVLFQQQKSHILLQPSVKQKQINARLIIGYSSEIEIITLVKNGIGGIFISQRNIQGKSYDEIKTFLHHLQSIRKQAGLPPLWITTDQEGGVVSRLTPLIKKQPPLASLLEQANAQELALAYGRQQGKALSALGVNVNFSPVVDLKPIKSLGALDFHSKITTRAISANPQQVVLIAKPYIQGLEQFGVIATLKHFPGLAKVDADTHHFSAKLPITMQNYLKEDAIPFIQLSNDTSTWIMLSHVIFTAIDADVPVSSSSKVVDGFIRKTLHINNKLITDDLTMGASYNRGFCKSIQESYAADINYLLISFDAEKYYDAILCLNGLP